MKIIVIGDGLVGRTIVENLCKERQEVTVIDTNISEVEEIIEKYDVSGVLGNGASYDILKAANAGKTDLVIAATSSDETNILACLIAKKLGAKSTIARVRNVEYSNQIRILQDDLGITMAVNPEKAAANEIVKLIHFPQALRMDSFAKGQMDLIEVYIPKDSKLVGMSLSEIYQTYQIKVLVCAVERKENVFIPSGNFSFEAEDKVYITADSKGKLKKFFNKSGLLNSKIKSVMIIGGSKISVYLASELVKGGYQVKIIEKNYDRCVELSQLVPEAVIIHGDASDQSLLYDEGIELTDALVCLTGSDEQNIIISMFADKHNVQKIITKINKKSLVEMMSTINMASIISPKDIVASQIISYVRAQNNRRGSNVNTLYKLVNDHVEAIEFVAKERSKVLGIPLMELKIKKNILVGGIIRDDSVIIPTGKDIIMEKDKVIVVTTNQFLDDLEDILE